MNRISHILAALAIFVASASPPEAHAAGDPARGSTLYHSTYNCIACHDSAPSKLFSKDATDITNIESIIVNVPSMRKYISTLLGNLADESDLAAYFAQILATPAAGSTVAVIEYHHASFDHYFITSVPAEIALLDAKTPPFQDWSRTGLSFNAYVNASAPATSVAICRFFNDHFAPKSSHFYAPHGLGCEDTISKFPDWTLEDDKLFNAALPDASGACPAGTVPVYRLYNNGMGGAPNHRFVTSLTDRQAMVDKGYVPEGSGIGVGMCVPP